MTHKFKPGDELMFEDHRSRYSRPICVVVHELLGTPDGCYTVKPLPAHHNGPKITAFEDELYRPREEWPENYDKPSQPAKMR